MKKFFLGIFIACTIQLGVCAQSFDRLTKIIDSSEVTNGQVAYFIGSYLGVVKETDSDLQAFDLLIADGYFSQNITADDKIKLNDLCAVYAKALNQKGGLMFTLSKKSGRYALREFKSKGWLPKNADPSMMVSGQNAIGLFNSITGAAE